jgi:hypothetical protein
MSIAEDPDRITVAHRSARISHSQNQRFEIFLGIQTMAEVRANQS